jgi:hypothetical protein
LIVTATCNVRVSEANGGVQWRGSARAVAFFCIAARAGRIGRTDQDAFEMRVLVVGVIVLLAAIVLFAAFIFFLLATSGFRT